MKTIQLPTKPPVNIKIWDKHNKHFWQYDYDGCPKYGPFKSSQQAIADAEVYSRG